MSKLLFILLFNLFFISTIILARELGIKVDEIPEILINPNKYTTPLEKHQNIKKEKILNENQKEESFVEIPNNNTDNNNINEKQISIKKNSVKNQNNITTNLLHKVMNGRIAKKLTKNSKKENKKKGFSLKNKINSFAFNNLIKKYQQNKNMKNKKKIKGKFLRDTKNNFKKFKNSFSKNNSKDIIKFKKKDSLKEGKKKILKFSESFKIEDIVDKGDNSITTKVQIFAEEARLILLDIYAIHHYTNYFLVWNQNKYMEQKEEESKENNEDNDDWEDEQKEEKSFEKREDETIKIEKQKNEEKALKIYYENLMDKLLFKAFTDKSPKAIKEFKNRIYKNKNGSSNSSSLLTTNMPFYVDVFLGKELESRDILIKNILNKSFISKLSKKFSWKGKKGNEKILQIEKIGSFYSIKHEIIYEKINIKSAEELFKYNDWLLSGGTWPSKMTNLAISIDKKCENIGEIKGNGENALCVIVRLFAFCLAIDNQFRSNEGKLLKYFRNMDVLYVEWIRESTNSILNYFNLKETEKVIETLIEEYNQFFEIVEKNPYINPTPGLLNKENQKKIQNKEKEIENFEKNNLNIQMPNQKTRLTKKKKTPKQKKVMKLTFLMKMERLIGEMKIF